MSTFRGINIDPIANFAYKVTFASIAGGNARAGFSSVDGLQATIEPITYREGTDQFTPRKLFGQTSYENVTLERGLTLDAELTNWHKLLMNIKNRGGANLTAAGDAAGAGGGALGDFVRREVTITLGDYHDERGGGAWTWTLFNAWPTEYSDSGLSGDGNEVVVESVVLCHEGLDKSRIG